MRGKVDVIVDCSYGSSGKGKLAAFLADYYGFNDLSSANYPNAGHTAVLDGVDGAPGLKFVAKALPTAAILNREDPRDCYLTPGSGFDWAQLGKEIVAVGFPSVFIHERCCVVDESHAARERSGAESTAHIASTMQGTAAAMADKIQRKKGVRLAGNYDLEQVALDLEQRHVIDAEEFLGCVSVVSGQAFRDLIHEAVNSADGLLHEGSQGYALSIDHGSHYPYCTSRNCTTSAALDYLGVAPQRLGDVWLNLRSYPIRVGSIAEGSSGDFYSDSEEITWTDVARRAGMPPEEAAALAERERTTVTKRVRRVSTFSMDNLRDAVRTCGATKLCLNFAQYLSWSDAGVTEFNDLSLRTLDFINSIQSATGIPVCLVGTGAKQSEMVVRDDYL